MLRLLVGVLVALFLLAAPVANTTVDAGADSATVVVAVLPKVVQFAPQLGWIGRHRHGHGRRVWAAWQQRLARRWNKYRAAVAYAAHIIKRNSRLAEREFDGEAEKLRQNRARKRVLKDIAMTALLLAAVAMAISQLITPEVAGLSLATTALGGAVTNKEGGSLNKIKQFRDRLQEITSNASNTREALDEILSLITKGLSDEVSPRQELVEKLEETPEVCTITHYIVPVSTETIFAGDIEIQQTIFGDKILNPKMKNPVEERECIAPRVGITVADSITLEFVDDEARQNFSKDPLVEAKFRKLLEESGYDLVGGTSMNKGTFYGVNWPGHGMRFAHESMGYLSLLFTPAGSLNGQSLVMHGVNTLVISGKEMRAAGLANDGGCLAFTSLGQYRMVIGNSVAKGAAIGYDEAEEAGVIIPDGWKFYDFVISVDDFKINNGKVKYGPSPADVVVTHDNIWTVKGQEIGLGFEFWQFVADSDPVYRLLNSELMARSLPSYEEMILGIENSRKLKAIAEGEKYEPLELHGKLMESLLVLGEEYPDVAEKLKATIVNYMITRPWRGTSYKLVMVVTKEAAARGRAYHHVEDGTATVLGGKFPMVAGIMQLAGDGSLKHFTVLADETAAKFNIDSDGDAMFEFRGTLADFLRLEGLIDSAVDLKLNKEKLERRDAELSMANLAKQGIHIFTSSAEIGRLTNLYYKGLIANKVYDMNLDMSPVLELIEYVIKGAKHKTEIGMGAKKSRIYDTIDVKELSKAIDMAWSRSARKNILTSFNTRDIEYGIDDVLNNRVQDPVHYMDYIWNLNLDRVEVEVKKLDAGKKPLASFANLVGSPAVPDTADEQLEMAVQIKELESLRAAWGQLGKGRLLEGYGSVMAKVVTEAGSTFSISARQKVTGDFLEKSTSKTGSFAVHLNYGSLGQVFGSNIAYSVRETDLFLVRIYDAGEGSERADLGYISRIEKDGDMFYVDNRIFNYGKGYEHLGNQVGNSDVVGYVPYITWNKEKKESDFSKSVWVLLKARS
ncbi:hypothetical protein [Acinetobacter sp.]|uniref:hypothetical protein n=1 Tax=Acinetobacter sp. TaxID=472 RepID=UPI003CFC7163